MHVVDECQIIVSEEIKRIDLNAEFEMLNCLSILLRFKVGYAHCIMELSTILLFYDFLASLECFYCLLVILHFIQCYSKIEKCFVAFCLSLIKKFNGHHFQLFPILALQNFLHIIFEILINLIILISFTGLNLNLFFNINVTILKCQTIILICLLSEYIFPVRCIIQSLFVFGTCSLTQ